MSDYTPITSELRAAMRQWGWVESDGSITFVSSPMPPSIDAEKSLAISGSDFDRCCDAIDSVHAQLERENASLKAELDRVLGEQEDRRSCIYYDPERHYCSCHDIDTDGLVRLPVDADGEPICVGDEMVADDGVAFAVECVSLYAWGWRVTGDGHDADGNSCTAHTYPELCRHHQPDTWERIIDDAEALAREWFNTDMSENEHAEGLDALVARCKALCERTKEEA